MTVVKQWIDQSFQIQVFSKCLYLRFSY